MAKRPLRSVQPDEKAPETPKLVRDAVDVSERAMLVSLRNKIACDIDAGVPAHALAPLARQLRELDRAIRVIDSKDEGDEVGNAAATPDEKWSASS